MRLMNHLSQSLPIRYSQNEKQDLKMAECCNKSWFLVCFFADNAIKRDLCRGAFYEIRYTDERPIQHHTFAALWSLGLGQ